MNNIYQKICISLVVGSISLALEQLEERNYGMAERLLREAWDKAAGVGPGPSGDPPRSVLLK